MKVTPVCCRQPLRQEGASSTSGWRLHCRGLYTNGYFIPEKKFKQISCDGRRFLQHPGASPGCGVFGKKRAGWVFHDICPLKGGRSWLLLKQQNAPRTRFRGEKLLSSVQKNEPLPRVWVLRSSNPDCFSAKALFFWSVLPAWLSDLHIAPIIVLNGANPGAVWKWTRPAAPALSLSKRKRGG